MDASTGKHYSLDSVINNINKVISENKAATSGRYTYLTIDDQSKTVGMTTDATKAASRNAIFSLTLYSQIGKLDSDQRNKLMIAVSILGPQQEILIKSNMPPGAKISNLNQQFPAASTLNPSYASDSIGALRTQDDRQARQRAPINVPQNSPTNPFLAPKPLPTAASTHAVPTKAPQQTASAAPPQAANVASGKPAVAPSSTVTNVQKANLGNVDPVKDPVGFFLGGTSDHTMKSCAVTFSAEGKMPEMSVNVATWNIMDKCFVNKKPGGFGNNPLNHTEDIPGYEARKRTQIKEIEAMITGGTVHGVKMDKLDAMSLQEIDFITKAALVKRDKLDKNGNLLPNQTLWPDDKMNLALRNELEAMLNKHGFSMMTTELPPPGNPAAGKAHPDPLAVIYNTKVMMPDPKNFKKGEKPHLTGCFEQTSNRQQIRGAEASFIHIETKREFDIVNLHLMFDVEPQKEIEEFQAGQIKKGKPSILCGDLNRTPNKALSSAIGDFNFPTNVDTLDVANRGKDGHQHLSTKEKDANGIERNKLYDVFLASPASQNGTVKVKEQQMGYFVPKANNQPGFDVEYANINRRHQGIPGYPWMRGRDLKAKLEKGYADLTPQDQKGARGLALQKSLKDLAAL